MFLHIARNARKNFSSKLYISSSDRANVKIWSVCFWGRSINGHSGVIEDPPVLSPWGGCTRLLREGPKMRPPTSVGRKLNKGKSLGNHWAIFTTPFGPDTPWRTSSHPPLDTSVPLYIADRLLAERRGFNAVELTLHPFGERFRLLIF